METSKSRREARIRRHVRVRKKISGTSEMPRLAIYRSLMHMYAQLIDDSAGVTLVSASTTEKDMREKAGCKGNVQFASAVGELLAKRAIEKKITKAVFDRAGYGYHGRVAAVADGARKAGLKF